MTSAFAVPTGKPAAITCTLAAVAFYSLKFMPVAQFTAVVTMAPFLYCQIVFATIAGWWVFGQVPDAQAFAGMALVGVCGSLGTWLASRQIVAEPRP